MNALSLVWPLKLATVVIVWVSMSTMTVHTYGQLIAKDLKVDGIAAPLGIDPQRPQFSWVLNAGDTRGVMQKAYRILVSSSIETLSRDHGDLWDSGQVESQSPPLSVPYAGRPLRPAEQAFWKIRVWTHAGDVSTWSEPQTIITGLPTEADWNPARWITLPNIDPKKQPGSVLLRREFEVGHGLKRATLFATGLAHFELSLNGAKIGTRLLSPGWTEYRKTVLYDTFDVTDQLQKGKNAAGILLGHGLYHIEPTEGRYVKFTHSFGPLRTIAHLQLEYEDGHSETIGTDSAWTAATGPITYSNVFGGEDFDGRLDPNGWTSPGFQADDRWTAATVIDGPGGQLRGESSAPPHVGVVDIHKPVSIKPTTRPGVTVYDLGQNASHMVSFVAQGPAGSRVRAIPSELLGPDGFVDRASCVQDKGGPAWWQLTLKGTGAAERFVPRFFYQGCRYLQVECLPPEASKEIPSVNSLEAWVMHSTAQPIGRFECSDNLFNQIYSLVRWAQRSNMMSVMTDCPQREKLGWLEQLHLNGPSLRYNFQLERLFAKQVADMADSQLDNGFVPNISPEYFLAHTDKLTDPFRNSVEWGSSFVIAPWQQYLFNGDTELLRRNFNRMEKYVTFLDSIAKDNIISHGLGDWYDLGPKPPWGSQLTPPPFTATAIYYYDLVILAEISTLLDKPEKATSYRAQAAKVRTAFNAKFFNPSTKTYATGSQCTSAMPLVLGLVEEPNRKAVLQALIDDIRKRGNALSAGDVGYRFVLRALADAGRSDVVFDMNHQSERPGYGMQIKKGATALTEKWDASVGSFGSHNHFMLGQINEWFFHDLAGIQPMFEGGGGFSHITIRPAPVGQIQWVKCSYDSPRGTISVHWRQSEGRPFEMEVTVPANVKAEIIVPGAKAASVREGHLPARDANGVTVLGDSEIGARFAVGSGKYHFQVVQ